MAVAWQAFVANSINLQWRAPVIRHGFGSVGHARHRLLSR
eukprot:SAG11_NODE_22094_length_412_cov_1.150160_1_plen_39_part_01